MDEDIKLMMKVKSNDDIQAFEELYKKYTPQIANFLYRLGVKPQDIEDDVQEIFFRLWKYRKRYEPKAKFKTFLYKITKNYWINKMRKEKLKSILTIFLNSKEKNIEEWQVDNNSPSDNIIAKELNIQIKNEINNLKEKYRIILVLAILEKLSYKEISEILNIPIGTVKSRIHIGIKELRKRLKKYLEKT